PGPERHDGRLRQGYEAVVATLVNLRRLRLLACSSAPLHSGPELCPERRRGRSQESGRSAWTRMSGRHGQARSTRGSRRRALLLTAKLSPTVPISLGGLARDER